MKILLRKRKKHESRKISPLLDLRVGYCNFDVCWSEVVSGVLAEGAVAAVLVRTGESYKSFGLYSLRFRWKMPVPPRDSEFYTG